MHRPAYPGREIGEEHAHVSPGQLAVHRLSSGEPVHGDREFPPVTGSMVIHAGNDPLEERGLSLGIRTGDRKHLPLPDPKTSDDPVAGRKFQFVRLKLPGAAERYVDPFLRPGGPEVAPVSRVMAGKPGSVPDERDEPPLRE